jgi:hypothetical protein
LEELGLFKGGSAEFDDEFHWLTPKNKKAKAKYRGLSATAFGLRSR